MLTPDLLGLVLPQTHAALPGGHTHRLLVKQVLQAHRGGGGVAALIVEGDAGLDLRKIMNVNYSSFLSGRDREVGVGIADLYIIISMTFLLY